MKIQCMTPLPDARLQHLPVKGRGTTTRLAHRFAGHAREAVDDGWTHGVDGATDEVPEPTRLAATQVTPEQARSILSGNQSPDIPFTWSINPYRGCEHVMWNSF